MCLILQKWKIVENLANICRRQIQTKDIYQRKLFMRLKQQK